MTRQLAPYASALALVVAGCSLVNDPAQHTGGAPDAEDSTDAGIDPSTDAAIDAPAPDRIEATELCTRLVTLQCNQYAHCCSRAPAGFDVAACIAAYLPPCRSSIGEYLVDERAGYDPERAAEAVARGEALSRECSTDIARWVSTREGLFGAFAGTVVPGSECTPMAEMDLAAFLSCDRLENACVPAFGDRFLCAARVDTGASCLSNGDCLAGLACRRSVPLDPSTGRCGPLLLPGAVCQTSTDCASYYCDIPTAAMVGTCVAATQDNIYCGVR